MSAVNCLDSVDGKGVGCVDRLLDGAVVGCLVGDRECEWVGMAVGWQRRRTAWRCPRGRFRRTHIVLGEREGTSGRQRVGTAWACR